MTKRKVQKRQKADGKRVATFYVLIALIGFYSTYNLRPDIVFGKTIVENVPVERAQDLMTRRSSTQILAENIPGIGNAQFGVSIVFPKYAFFSVSNPDIEYDLKRSVFSPNTAITNNGLVQRGIAYKSIVGLLVVAFIASFALSIVASLTRLRNRSAKNDTYVEPALFQKSENWIIYTTVALVLSSVVL